MRSFGVKILTLSDTGCSVNKEDCSLNTLLNLSFCGKQINVELVNE